MRTTSFFSSLGLALIAVAALAVTQALAATDAPDAGATLYQNKCAACHGLTGMGSVGPAFAGNARLEDSLHVADALVNGFGRMPAFGANVTDEDLALVASYIRSTWGNGFGPMTAEDFAARR